MQLVTAPAAISEAAAAAVAVADDGRIAQNVGLPVEPLREEELGAVGGQPLYLPDIAVASAAAINEVSIRKCCCFIKIAF